MADPVELVLLCSLFTSTHMALLGFDPLTEDEWLCFGLWDLAEAAVSGARANVNPSTPMQIPIHFDRCSTAATSRSRNQRFDVSARLRFRLGLGGLFDLLRAGFGLNRRPASVMVES
jgi:hypothetical protein